MKRLAILAAIAGTAAAGLAGCGGDDIPKGVPDVRGLSLPVAETQLKHAKLAASYTSDGMFGVIVKGNWIVCDQNKPKGRLVPLEVRKDCGD